MGKYTNIERVFGLGIGSLQGEELEKPETKALLKLVNVFPWLLDIAEYKFDKQLSGLYLQAVALEIKIQERKKAIEELPKQS